MMSQDEETESFNRFECISFSLTQDMNYVDINILP